MFHTLALILLTGVVNVVNIVQDSDSDAAISDRSSEVHTNSDEELNEITSELEDERGKRIKLTEDNASDGPSYNSTDENDGLHYNDSEASTSDESGDGSSSDEDDKVGQSQTEHFRRAEKTEHRWSVAREALKRLYVC